MSQSLGVLKKFSSLRHSGVAMNHLKEFVTPVDYKTDFCIVRAYMPNAYKLCCTLKTLKYRRLPYSNRIIQAAGWDAKVAGKCLGFETIAEN